MQKLTDKDKSVGVITSPITKRLFLASRMFAVASKEYAVKSAGAETDEGENEFKRLAAKYDQMEDVCREILWTQVRDDLNLFHPVTDIGIRESWMVVEVDSSSPEVVIEGLEGLKQIMGHLKRLREEAED